MTELKVKSRGWVKNAAIIFLLVMLGLTFFSNTILNRSLPEVATSYAMSGTINTKIRGSGTVSANEKYEITVKETRKVRTVAIRLGDKVSPGDLLFVLAEGDSTELEAAKDALEALQLQYQKEIISASENDYARQNRDIRLAREALQEAIAKRDSLFVTDADVSNARTEVSIANAKVISQKEIVAKAQEDLNNVGGGSDNSSQINALYRQLQAKRAELTQAEQELAAIKVVYGGAYDNFIAVATERMKAELGDDMDDPAVLKLYVERLAAERKAATTLTPEEKAEYEAYLAVSAAEKKVADLKAERDVIQRQYNDAVGEDTSDEYAKYAKRLKTAQDLLDTLESQLKKREEELTKLETKQTDYKAAVETVKSSERSLEDLVFTLTETQKTDNIQAQLKAIDLQKLRKDIAEAEKKLNDLSGSSAGTEIRSEVAGVVTAINISAGNETVYNESMATVEVVDRGYSLSFSVTNDQSSKISIGETADVTGWWWGNVPRATLVAMRNDPQAPRDKKLLVFDIVGEVEAGTQLNLSVGQRSQTFDVIVPNSAVRTDNNGSFVLIVEAKSSPLGNRYIARRADVNVLATDDVNSAVAGGVSNNDFVITTSTKPIEPGMQVRMAET